MKSSSRVTVHMAASLDLDVALHLVEAKACKSGMVALRYEVVLESHP